MRKNVRVATDDTPYKFRRGRNFPSSTNEAHLRRPACGEMGMDKRQCRRIAIIKQMRASYNGNTLASQARAEGSIPFARSRISATYIFYSVRMAVSATASKLALPAPSSQLCAPKIKTQIAIWRAVSGIFAPKNAPIDLVARSSPGFHRLSANRSALCSFHPSRKDRVLTSEPDYRSFS